MLADNYASCSRNKITAHISIQFLFASVITTINRRHAFERAQALHFGQLSGYFTNDNKLTPMGRQVAQYLKDGLAA